MKFDVISSLIHHCHSLHSSLVHNYQFLYRPLLHLHVGMKLLVMVKVGRLLELLQDRALVCGMPHQVMLLLDMLPQDVRHQVMIKELQAEEIDGMRRQKQKGVRIIHI